MMTTTLAFDWIGQTNHSRRGGGMGREGAMFRVTCLWHAAEVALRIVL